MQLCRITYYSLAALHVSSDIFAHHQEHQNCITASGITHVCRCRLVAMGVLELSSNTPMIPAVGVLELSSNTPMIPAVMSAWFGAAIIKLSVSPFMPEPHNDTRDYSLSTDGLSKSRWNCPCTGKLWSHPVFSFTVLDFKSSTVNEKTGWLQTLDILGSSFLCPISSLY